MAKIATETLIDGVPRANAERRLDRLYSPRWQVSKNSLHANPARLDLLGIT